MDPTDEGLALLGWYMDSRATSEDEQMLVDIARRALALKSDSQLNPEKRIELSLAAHKILYAGLLDFGERASLVTFQYVKSEHLAPDVRLVDESMLAFYRGYPTAALSLLFVVLERYLRSLLGWTPDKPKPKFKDLTRAVGLLPPGRFRDISERTVSMAYGLYNPDNPPIFLMNRHGLHHGLRGVSDLDTMNFARLIGLFDTLVGAELGGLSRGFVADERFRLRFAAYSNCGFAGVERVLLGDVKLTVEE